MHSRGEQAVSDVMDQLDSAATRRLPSVVLTEAQKQKPIWDLVDEVLTALPPEELDRVPYSAAENIDQFLYGSPSEPTR